MRGRIKRRLDSSDSSEPQQKQTKGSRQQKASALGFRLDQNMSSGQSSRSVYEESELSSIEQNQIQAESSEEKQSKSNSSEEYADESGEDESDSQSEQESMEEEQEQESSQQKESEGEWGKKGWYEISSISDTPYHYSDVKSSQSQQKQKLMTKKQDSKTSRIEEKVQKKEESIKKVQKLKEEPQMKETPKIKEKEKPVQVEEVPVVVKKPRGRPRKIRPETEDKPKYEPKSVTGEKIRETQEDDYEPNQKRKYTRRLRKVESSERSVEEEKPTYLNDPGLGKMKRLDQKKQLKRLQQKILSGDEQVMELFDDILSNQRLASEPIFLPAEPYFKHQYSDQYKERESQKVRESMGGLANHVANIDKETFYRVHLPRLRAAHIEGFEGPRNLSIKMNKKRKLDGLPPINLMEECKADLELRKEDQYHLFCDMVRATWEMHVKGSQLGRSPNETQNSNVWDSFRALQQHMDARRAAAVDHLKFVTLTKPKVQTEELNIAEQFFKFLPVASLKNKPRQLNTTEQRKVDHTFSILGKQFEESIDKIYDELEQSKLPKKETKVVKKVDEEMLFKKHNYKRDFDEIDLNDQDEEFIQRRKEFLKEQDFKAQRGLQILTQSSWKVKDLPKELDYSIISLIIFIVQKSISDMRKLNQNINFGHPGYKDLRSNSQLIQALDALPVSPYKICESLDVLLIDRKEKKKQMQHNLKTKQYEQKKTRELEAFQMERDHYIQLKNELIGEKPELKVERARSRSRSSENQNKKWTEPEYRSKPQSRFEKIRDNNDYDSKYQRSNRAQSISSSNPVPNPGAGSKSTNQANTQYRPENSHHREIDQYASSTSEYKREKNFNNGKKFEHYK